MGFKRRWQLTQIKPNYILEIYTFPVLVLEYIIHNFCHRGHYLISARWQRGVERGGEIPPLFKQGTHAYTMREAVYIFPCLWCGKKPNTVSQGWYRVVVTPPLLFLCSWDRHQTTCYCNFPKQYSGSLVKRAERLWSTQMWGAVHRVPILLEADNSRTNPHRRRHVRST